MPLRAHQTALFVGIAAGIIFAFFRKGTTSGNGVAFDGK